MRWRKNERSTRGAQARLFVSFASLLLLLALWLSLSRLHYPPPPSPHLILRQLPWLAAAGDGSFTSLCTNPAGGSKADPPRVYLAALIFNRVFSGDLFRIRPYECKQWIEYMLYAGVEHIYWYDTAHSDAEAIEAYLRPYIHAGLLTYFRFHSLFPDSLLQGFHFEQDNSYQHFLANFAQSTRWVVQMDVDEYPFSAVDGNSCFLRRFLREYEVLAPNVTQILVQCMIFAGNPQGDLVDGWVIERYQRRKHETEGTEEGDKSRQKPIYRADLCKGIWEHNPHVVWMQDGQTIVAGDERMRMNHYWGARVTDFKPDTPETIHMLLHDSSIQPIASRIKHATGLSQQEDGYTIGSFLRSTVWPA